jgi:MFS family permease
MADTDASKAGAAARAMILPLALAQFIASYAATNMNVAISAIASDLGTTVAGVQTAITLFTLTMAALMIPGSKLTDIWGRKRCFVLGLAIYAVGGLLAALSQGLPQLIIGYSLLEGVGSALVAVKLPEGKPFAAALIVMLVITLIGLVLAVLIPRKPIETTEPASPGTAPAASKPANTATE